MALQDKIYLLDKLLMSGKLKILIMLVLSTKKKSCDKLSNNTKNTFIYLLFYNKINIIVIVVPLRFLKSVVRYLWVYL